MCVWVWVCVWVCVCVCVCVCVRACVRVNARGWQLLLSGRLCHCDRRAMHLAVPVLPSRISGTHRRGHGLLRQHLCSLRPAAMPRWSLVQPGRVPCRLCLCRWPALTVSSRFIHRRCRLHQLLHVSEWPVRLTLRVVDSTARPGVYLTVLGVWYVSTQIRQHRWHGRS